ncbi:hypothetical protein C8R48DRAFT_678576 [Suillus tomentosus]|nr:hypothetical protein C8R48DRAFT_678576 [Suillus tomentosus]
MSVIAQRPELGDKDRATHLDSQASTPRISANLERKLVDLPNERRDTRNEVPNSWTEIDQLKEQIRALEQLVIRSQSREEETRRQYVESHQAPVTSMQGHWHLHKDTNTTQLNVELEEGKTHPTCREQPADGNRYQRALSILLAKKFYQMSRDGQVVPSKPGPR